MEEIVEIIKNVTVIGGSIAALITLISVAVTLINGLKCLMRSQMLHTYYRHKDTKQIRQYEMQNFLALYEAYKAMKGNEMQNFLALYEAYKAMKGNSFIDEIHEDVTSWEIIT